MTPAAIQRRKTELLNHLKNDNLKLNSYEQQHKKEQDDKIDDSVLGRI